MRTLDVLVVGGGPAGLSAALMLGRCRRKVMVVDAGRPRNRASPRMHGYLSRDGIAPGEFLAISRNQLLQYPNVEFYPGEVEALRKTEAGFDGRLAGGIEVAAKTVLLAMGIVDILPDLPDISEFYGKSVHHCPYCDGWEHRDARIAVLGEVTAGVDLAREMKGWSSDILYCANGQKMDEGSKAALARLDIEVVEAPIERLEGTEGRLQLMHFKDGTCNPRSAIFFAGRQKQHSSLVRQLGCDLTDNDFVECGDGVCTNVEGVYAAGNTASGLQMALIAAAEGTKAAWAINQSLLERELPG